MSYYLVNLLKYKFYYIVDGLLVIIWFFFYLFKNEVYGKNKNECVILKYFYGNILYIY